MFLLPQFPQKQLDKICNPCLLLCLAKVLKYNDPGISLDICQLPLLFARVSLQSLLISQWGFKVSFTLLSTTHLILNPLALHHHCHLKNVNDRQLKDLNQALQRAAVLALMWVLAELGWGWSQREELEWWQFDVSHDGQHLAFQMDLIRDVCVGACLDRLYPCMTLCGCV